LNSNNREGFKGRFRNWKNCSKTKYFIIENGGIYKMKCPFAGLMECVKDKCQFFDDDTAGESVCLIKNTLIKINDE
jgi:hypothetical protein